MIVPLYHYKCQNCEYEAHLNESIKANSIKTCPICKVYNKFIRVPQKSTFILKGAGWSSNSKQ